MFVESDNFFLLTKSSFLYIKKDLELKQNLRLEYSTGTMHFTAQFTNLKFSS